MGSDGPSAATVTSAIRCCADQTGAQLPGAQQRPLRPLISSHPTFPLPLASEYQAPMAYRQNSQRHNPYNENQYGSPPQQQQQNRNEFNEDYGGHSNARYNDSYDTYGDYNTYNNQNPHQTYEQGGYNQYTGVAGHPDEADRGTPSPEGDPPAPPSKETYGNTTAYEHDHDDQMPQVRPRGKLPSSCVVLRVHPPSADH